MATAVQLNTRIDAVLKQSGDAVFSRNGYSSSEVVRAVWRYAAEHQAVPPFMEKRDVRGGCPSSAASRATAGAGLAVRVAAESCGYRPSDQPLLEKDRERLRDDMYDCMLEEMEARCR